MDTKQKNKKNSYLKAWLYIALKSNTTETGPKINDMMQHDHF